MRVTSYDETNTQRNTYVTDVRLNSGEDVNRKGDSGAPVGSGSTYMGMATSIQFGHTQFSRASNIAAYTNGTPITFNP